jgi:predicted dehydrogenase
LFSQNELWAFISVSCGRRPKSRKNHLNNSQPRRQWASYSAVRNYMSIKEALGFGLHMKVRYAIVGLGDIAQEDMMPGVDHTGNSVITALVTSDAKKALELSAKYKVEATFTYEEFPKALASGIFDAIYVATPNWRHGEFVVPSLRAGIHVLCEKPMEVSTAKCREILDVAKTTSAKLMIGYRLHFEPGTLATIEVVRSGKLWWDPRAA